MMGYKARNFGAVPSIFLEELVPTLAMTSFTRACSDDGR